MAILAGANGPTSIAKWTKLKRKFLENLLSLERPTLAVDGKTLRRGHNRKKDLGALHSVSVWASEFGLSLTQVATDQKSNEITAIPRALSLVVP